VQEVIMSADEAPSLADVLKDLCEHPVGGGPAWTNVALAEACGGITQAYIASLRSGRQDNPTVEVLVKLGEALGRHPAALVGGRGDLREGEQPGWRRTALAGLFATNHPADRGPYTPGEVAKAISEHGAFGTINRRTVQELRDGANDNPKLKHVLGLAWFFGVAPAYFFDDELAAQVDAEFAEGKLLRELGVVALVTRISERLPELSPGTKDRLRGLVDRALDPELQEGDWVFHPRPRSGDGGSPAAGTGAG
jgi:transcriptional regulator with XRE-family HTH domain